jgi:dolichol-phosphate mannosyltransferase
MPRELTVILPTLNEEEGVEIVMKALAKAGATRVLVLDGGSTDRTVEIAKKLGATVMVQEGRGKGMAFQTFLKKYPIKDDAAYVMLDADASYAGSEIMKIAAALKDADVVTGSRPPLIFGFRSFVHYIGGFLISVFASVLFLRWNPDITSGYWGFRGLALKKLDITSHGFELEANLFAQSAKKGLKAVCVPITYGKRVGTAKLSFLDALKIVPKLLSERLSG